MGNVGNTSKFRSADAHTRLPMVSRWAGLPTGVQLYSDFWFLYQPFNVAADLPVDATTWTITETGIATQTLSDDLFPPHLILTNAAADNDSQELQWTAADASGEFVDLSDGRVHYFETLVRFRDANNDDDTVEQVEWFLGFAVTDTTVLDGATDFVGFRKRDLDDDATQSIDFVSADAGGAAGALVDGLVQPTGWTTLNPAAVLPDTTDGRRDAEVVGPNEWVKLGFLLLPNADGSGGTAYCFVNGRPRTGPIDLAGQVPDQNTCVTIAVQNGEAVAKIMDMAYFAVAIAYEAGVSVDPSEVFRG